MQHLKFCHAFVLEVENHFSIKNFRACGYEVLKVPDSDWLVASQFKRREFIMSPDQQLEFQELVFSFSLW